MRYSSLESFQPCSQRQILKERHNEVWLLSSLAAALWSVNPIHTQPVVYIVQRMTLLASLFSLLSFYFLFNGEAGTRKWYSVLSLAAWLLAVGSKENAFLLPLSFLAYEWLFTDRRFFRLKNLATLSLFSCVWLDSPSSGTTSSIK